MYQKEVQIKYKKMKVQKDISCT